VKNRVGAAGVGKEKGRSSFSSPMAMGYGESGANRALECAVERGDQTNPT
jgi:hypothetical protein